MLFFEDHNLLLGLFTTSSVLQLTDTQVSYTDESSLSVIQAIKTYCAPQLIIPIHKLKALQYHYNGGLSIALK